MQDPNESKSSGHKTVAAHQQASLQANRQDGRSDSRTKSASVPSTAHRAEPEPEKHPDPDPDQELKDAIYNGDCTGLQAELRKRPGFVVHNTNFGHDKDPLLHYIIRYCKRAENVKPLVQKLVEHDYPPGSAPPRPRSIAEREAIVKEVGDSGRTALHCACYRNQFEVVKYLLDFKNREDSNINNTDFNGNTALLVAVTNLKAPIDLKSMARLLLTNGADPNAVGGVGTEQNENRTALHKAAGRRHASGVVRLLLQKQAKVDPRDQYNKTPLHDAADSGSLDAVKDLLDEGAEVDARTARRWTPLHKASSKGHGEVVKMLLMYGASRESFTRDRKTPESLAVEFQHLDVVKLFQDPELLKESMKGRSPKARRLNLDQARLCTKFNGIVWQNTMKIDRPSVWDMLYRDQEKPPRQPSLKELLTRGRATWIHLPANNRTWVEDVFKVIYECQEGITRQECAIEKDGEVNETAPLSLANAQNVLRNILQFIDDHFNEESLVTSSRQPHFISAQGPNPRPRKNRMMSMVFPVIDTDMQQPRFFDPSKVTKTDKTDGDQNPSKDTHDVDETRKKFDEYRVSEGRPLAESEKNHVKHMEELEREYSSIHSSRTLDESFHQMLGEQERNERNGDQVLSKYLARSRMDWDDRKAAQLQSAVAKAIAGHTKVEHGASAAEKSSVRRDRRHSRIHVESDGEMEDSQEDRGDSEHDKDNLEQEIGNENTSQRGSTQLFAGTENVGNVSPGAQNTTEQDAITPYRLEDQSKMARRSTIWTAVTNCLLPRGASSSDRLATDVIGSAEGATLAEECDLASFSNRNRAPNKSEGKHESQDQTPRQQILVVPQLWLWKVEDIIVTAYPDKWDSSVPSRVDTLPETILRDLKRRAAGKEVQDISPMNIDELLVSIIETVSNFEPLFNVQDGKRNYHDAFAGEIAHVSGQVAQAYKGYRETLGHASKSFAQGVKNETDYLVTVDDILSELSMIKRVEQDQQLVGPAAMRQLRNSQTFRAAGSLATYKTRDYAAKLDRQMDDALRVRHSIITLLDLRQKQASTESALDSGYQSDVLFDQSKIIFIFTSATVLFAPLSWVSSLMALKIDNFTPDSWGQAQASIAFVVSLIATLLLCLLGWKFNNIKEAADAKSKAQNTSTEGQVSKGFGGGHQEPGVLQRLIGSNISWPKKRQHKTS